MNCRQIHADHDAGVYRRRDLVMVRGAGARLWDEEGREYIDCVAGIGAAGPGHCHPAVTEAVAAQARTLLTCSNLFMNKPAALLMQTLAALAPAGLTRCFFCNSGAESVEAALKFARYSTGRPNILCAEGSFHGRTMGALSATHRPSHRQGFGPLLQGFRFVPYGDASALERAAGPQTAAVLLEIVQGEGGVRFAGRDYFAAVSEMCRRRNILLIIDEVQTGFCRTGKMFACEHVDLAPDILCLAKAAAGGLPLGITLSSDKISMTAGSHGSTFGGNPLVCAASLAALRVMESEELAGRAARMGDLLAELLGTVKSSKIREIRHLGLMAGIELTEPAGPYVDALQQRGVLVLTAGEYVIRLLPSLIIPEDDIRQAAQAITEVLQDKE